MVRYPIRQLIAAGDFADDDALSSVYEPHRQHKLGANRTMKDDPQHTAQSNLRTLCRAAGQAADQFQRGSATAHSAVDQARRMRRWRAAAVVALGAVAVAVVAAQYSGGIASSDLPAGPTPPSQREHAAVDLAVSPKPVLTSPEAVARSIMARPNLPPQAVEPDHEPKREPATQAEKELAASQPDGSC
jgi:hypothetical protein